MKKIVHYRVIILSVFIAMSCTACVEGFEEEFFPPEDDEFFIESEEYQVYTSEPEVSSSRAIFKAEIRTIQNPGSVKYGFMWYAIEGDQYLDPIKVEVGSTTTPTAFSIEMLDLPVNTQLIVCAYVESNPLEGQSIGNEEDFTVPK